MSNKICGPIEKMRFLPYAFAEFYPLAEQYVYDFMARHAVGYDGGSWEFIVYANGACAFIAPDSYQFTLPNYFDEPVSAEEAGIIVALYAYSHFCCVAYARGWERLNEMMAERYHTLRDYTATLSPASQSRIFRAID
ncbi:ArdB protein [Salmonella enterica subsp. enterica serovar Hvittingfoss]|nr:ArdB protein [Salmonella enterica subsp. enterica serovar Hvittingfoss]